MPQHLNMWLMVTVVPRYDAGQREGAYEVSSHSSYISFSATTVNAIKLHLYNYVYQVISIINFEITLSESEMHFCDVSAIPVCSAIRLYKMLAGCLEHMPPGR